jgi:hypothetical protein
MNDNFEIPVSYKGKEHLFPASLITSAYTYKIQVEVYGKLISFEPDEERSFRAVIGIEDLHDTGKIDKVLLQEIAHSIESIVK